MSNTYYEREVSEERWTVSRPGLYAVCDNFMEDPEKPLIVYLCDAAWGRGYGPYSTEPGELHHEGHPLPVWYLPEGITDVQAQKRCEEIGERVHALKQRLGELYWVEDRDGSNLWYHARTSWHVRTVIDFEADEVRTNRRELEAKLAGDDLDPEDRKAISDAIVALGDIDAEEKAGEPPSSAFDRYVDQSLQQLFNLSLDEVPELTALQMRKRVLRYQARSIWNDDETVGQFARSVSAVGEDGGQNYQAVVDLCEQAVSTEYPGLPFIGDTYHAADVAINDEALIGYDSRGRLIATFRTDHGPTRDTSFGDVHPAGHRLPYYRFPEGTTFDDAMEFLNPYVQEAEDLVDRLLAEGYEQQDFLRFERDDVSEPVYIVVDFDNEEVRCEPTIDGPVQIADAEETTGGQDRSAFNQYIDQSLQRLFVVTLDELSEMTTHQIHEGGELYGKYPNQRAMGEAAQLGKLVEATGGYPKVEELCKHALSIEVQDLTADETERFSEFAESLSEDDFAVLKEAIESAYLYKDLVFNIETLRSYD